MPKRRPTIGDLRDAGDRSYNILLEPSMLITAGFVPRKYVPTPREPKYDDLTDQQFGWLTALLYGFSVKSPSGSMAAHWLCLCRCGRYRLVSATSLKKGTTKSCGCKPKRSRWDDIPGPRRKDHPLYGVWKAMRQRCCNVNNRSFPNYGGRGVRVCDRWAASFWAFVADMGERPDGYSLERIDNNGNYDPANCCWADRLTQRHNQRPHRKKKPARKGPG